MKTSNILLTIAAVFSLGTLTAYDFGLKTEYLTMKKQGLEKYQKANRFNNYKEVKVAHFSDIQLKAANAFNVSVEYGEKEAVWINKYAKSNIQINQSGEKLLVDLSSRGKEEKFNNFNYNVVIICPRIDRISTYANIDEKSLEDENSKGNRMYSGTESSIKGFNQNSLTMIINPFTQIKMNHNSIRSFNATVGNNNGAGQLFIHSENTLNNLSLNVMSTSVVEILDDDIQHFQNSISDEATVAFRGVALSKIK